MNAHFLISPPPSLESLLDSSVLPNGSSNLTEETIATLQNKHKAQQAISLRAVHRLCTSVTTFETRDPDPAAVDDGYVFGIRIEVFSSQTREFQIPYYILLNRPWRTLRGSDDFRLHRHTFPPFVPVKDICKKRLPTLPLEGEGDDRPHQQDLLGLASDLRRHVASCLRREDAIAKMGSNNAEFVSRITLPGAENLEANVYLKTGSTANMRLDAKGRIQKVSAKDNVGRRLHALERQLQRMARIENLSLSET